MRFIFSILLFLLFVGCEKSDRNDIGHADTTIVSDSTKADSALSIENEEYAPSWYLSIPETEGYIYAIGMAKSRRANIASNKALLNAQVSMGKKLKRLELKSNESEKTLGADSDPDNDNFSITMQDILVKNKKRVKVGDIWYYYVLLELKQKK